jgi:hypothetical protein
MNITSHVWVLDVSLYEGVSIGRLVCWSVVWSVRWSVSRYSLTAEFKAKWLNIEGKVKDWVLGCPANLQAASKQQTTSTQPLNHM